MKLNDIKTILESKPYLKSDLFIRGFLITDKEQTNLNDFPFYGNWNVEKHGKYYFMAHTLTGMHIYEDENGNCFFLMGHAYNPFSMEYEYDKIPSAYPPADMHYNEVGWGSWGSLNITEMKYCFDITFIYNNRRFLDLMFRVPLEKRISDQHHLDMKKHLNKDLFDMNIRVVNLKETRMRAFLLNVIFEINSILP